MEECDRDSPCDVLLDSCGQMDVPLSSGHYSDGSAQDSFFSSDLDWIEELSEEDVADGDLAPVADSGKKRTCAETARMFKLRRNLDELDSFHRQKEHDVLQAREALGLCKQNVKSLLEQKVNLEKEINQQKAADNSVAVFRLQVQHKSLSQKLENEVLLEEHVSTELQQLELELSRVEVELGRFSSFRKELQAEEQVFRVVKAQKAVTRLQQERKIIQNLQLRIKNLKDQQAAMMQEQKNQMKSEDGRENQSTPSKESSESKQTTCPSESKKKGEGGHANKTQHKAGSKYLKDTFERVHKQEVEKEEQDKHLYEKRMQAVTSLKSNIAATQECLRAQQAKAKALALKKEEEEKQQKESLQNQDIGSVKYLYQLQHLDELKRKREEFEEKLRKKKEAIVAKTLQEEKHGKGTKKDQAKTSKPSTTDNMASLAKAKEDLQILLGPRPASPTERGATAFGLLHDLSSSSSASSDEEDQEGTKDVEMDQQGPSESLAEPEFSGLWDQQYKPEKPPKETPKPKEKPIKTRIKLDKPRKAVKKSPFVSKPEVVIFKDFDIGKTYKKKIMLTNTSSTTNHLRLLGVTKKLEDFIVINFDPPGSVPAGMSCEMQATFQPLINEDLEGEVNFISSGGSFNLPIKCTTKKCEIEVESEDIDFGSHVLGQVISRTITLTNKGALSTRYRLEIRCPTPKAPSPVSAQECQVRPQETGSQNASAGSVSNGAAEEQPREPSEEKENQQPEESHPENPEEIPVSTDMEAQVEESAPEIFDINLGEIREGDISPFESITFEVIFTPTVPGEAELDFDIKFTNPLAKMISMHAHGIAVSIPVWVVQPNIDLKICMFDCLYQDTVTIKSSATVTLKVTFEVCQEMRKHMEIFPKNGFIQAQSTLNAQLKFQPRHNLAKDAGAYFDSETGVLQVPALLHVFGQVQPIPFAVHAVVTCSDLKFDRAEVDFGYCSIYQSIKNTVRLTNLSLLPQDFGFLNVPKYVEIQPNDGFGTLLPQETLEIGLILSAVKAIDYKFSLHCKSGMNRDFLLSCRGVGVRPPLELSHTLVNFGATAIGDHSTAVIILKNHQSSRFRAKPQDASGVKDGSSPLAPRLFSFLLPNNSDITLAPATGRLLPGEKCLIQVTFKPTFLDREIKEEGLRLLQEAALQKQLEEMALIAQQEEDLKKEVQPEPVKEKKDKKNSAKSQKTDTSGDQVLEKVAEPPTIDDVVEGSELYEQAKTSLLHTFAPRYVEHTIPCFISDGDPPEDNRQAQPPWSPFNTLYLQLQCPAVRPCLLVSDNQQTIIDFQQVSIGDKVIKGFTVQNISDDSFQLKSSVLDIFGPFSILNALRIIKPGDQHTLLLAFHPSVDKKFCEVLEIKTPTMNLEVTLRGEGVIPDVTSSHPGGLLDFGYVLEKESTVRVIELHNSSPVAVGFRVLLASLCPSRPKGGIEHLDILLGDYTDPELQPVVGTQNYNGANVFSVVPAEGIIGPGQSQNITIVFQPDHPSIYYSDKLTIEIMNKKNLCIIDLKGAASSHNMYLYGGDMLTVPIESLLPPLTDYQTPPSEENDITTPVLVTLRASISEGVTTPAVRELKVGCIRSTQSKKGGEFFWDDMSPLQQQGFTVEPLKSSVEAGKEVTVTISWSPQSGYKPYEVVQARVLLTVRGEQRIVYSVNLMALVSYSSPSSSPPSPTTSVVPM